MKTLLPALLASLLLSAAPAFGAATKTPTPAPAAPATPAKPAAPKTETIDLQSRGRVVLTLPPGWSAVREDPDNPLDVTLKAPPGVNATAEFTFGFPNEGAYETAADVRARATELGEAQEDESVERRTVLQMFKLRSGYGFYSHYTDPKLVGKKPVPGDYKVLTVGIIRPSPGLVAIISILCDDVAGPDFQQLRQVVETLELLGPGGARRKAEF